jgi:hypothetical protein
VVWSASLKLSDTSGRSTCALMLIETATDRSPQQVGKDVEIHSAALPTVIVARPETTSALPSDPVIGAAVGITVAIGSLRSVALGEGPWLDGAATHAARTGRIKQRTRIGRALVVILLSSFSALHWRAEPSSPSLGPSQEVALSIRHVGADEARDLAR